MNTKYKGEKMKGAFKLLKSFTNWWNGTQEMVFNVKARPKRKYTKTSKYWKKKLKNIKK